MFIFFKSILLILSLTLLSDVSAQEVNQFKRKDILINEEISQDNLFLSLTFQNMYSYAPKGMIYMNYSESEPLELIIKDNKGKAISRYRIFKRNSKKKGFMFDVIYFKVIIDDIENYEKPFSYHGKLRLQISSSREQKEFGNTLNNKHSLIIGENVTLSLFEGNEIPPGIVNNPNNLLLRIYSYGKKLNGSLLIKKIGKRDKFIPFPIPQEESDNFYYDISIKKEEINDSKIEFDYFRVEEMTITF